DVTLRGHAIECRIYAEDPDNNFFPSPGKIVSRQTPAGPGIRLDDGVYVGWVVPTDYDPLLGKLSAWGSDRAEAIVRLGRALNEYSIGGIRTNLNLFRRLLVDPEFLRGEIHTRWLDEWLWRAAGGAAGAGEGLPEPLETAAVLAAALFHLSSGGVSGNGGGSGAG